ncbi:Sterile alpha motif/pointed domain,Sterile alpha motif domain [Cinara cedri]|uniref:Sterile alpha motif/pointed domain,Sterile alpha motif domain n=1 Tax=Cinara cedri TaxID=506608 RepID=A0A5E4MUF1_9HEMI|nr:Sterile alpha motif/pointed domain,Sterile alpha motif domain [Cinara cedri]
MEEPLLPDEELEFQKIQGLDLILKSVNCEQYKSKFEDNEINEQAMLLLTESDLKYLEIKDKDCTSILNAINILRKTINSTEIKLSNEDISNIQSNICGQLGNIALILNHIYCSINNDKNKFDDILIDDYLSSIDAALMLKPYMEAEEKNIEKSLKRIYKIKNRRSILITTTACTLLLLGVGLTIRYLNKP